VRARERFAIDSDGVRLVHGESDGLPGLIVDRYGDTLVAQFLSAGAQRWKPVLADALLRVSGLTRLYERSDTAPGFRARAQLLQLHGRLHRRRAGKRGGRGAVGRFVRAGPGARPRQRRAQRPGGVLFTYSCSGGIGADLFHKIVASAATIDAGVDGYVTQRLGGAPDHPMTLVFPEGEYLKGLVIVRR